MIANQTITTWPHQLRLPNAQLNVCHSIFPKFTHLLSTLDLLNRFPKFLRRHLQLPNLRPNSYRTQLLQLFFFTASDFSYWTLDWRITEVSFFMASLKLMIFGCQMHERRSGKDRSTLLPSLHLHASLAKFLIECLTKLLPNSNENVLHFNTSFQSLIFTFHKLDFLDDV